PAWHPIPLNIGWDVSSGSWVSGLWTPDTVPAWASGPTFDPPCDDVLYEWLVDPLGDQQVAIFSLRGDGGSVVASSGPQRLVRINYVTNPALRYGTSGWVAGSDVDLSHSPGVGILTSQASLPDGHVWVTSNDSGPQPSSDWSGSMTVEAVGIDAMTNLVPDPSATSLTWVETTVNYDLTVSTEQAFSGTTSWKSVAGASAVVYSGLVVFGGAGVG